MIIENDIGFLLKKVQYNSNSYVLKILSKNYGLMSFFVRVNKTNRKYLFPMSYINITYDKNPKKDIQLIKSIYLESNYLNILSNFTKSNILLFINELLYKLIFYESIHDARIFNYIEKKINELNNQEISNDFHLIFLMELSEYMGIKPNIKNNKINNDNFFDLIDKEDSILFTKLFNNSFDNNYRLSTIIFNTFERKKLINLMIKYYEFHFVNLKINSVEILSTLYI